AHDCRAAVTPVIFHSLAALALPGEHLVLVLEARHQRVIELPIVSKLISASRGSHSLRIVDAQGPSAYLHLVRSVIERFAGSIVSEPVPVIRLDVVLIRTARRWTLPQIPVQLFRYRHFFAGSDGLPHIAVPRFREIRSSNRATMNFVNNFDCVR